MKKRVIVVISGLALSLVGCNSTSPNSSATDAQVQQEQQEVTSVDNNDIDSESGESTGEIDNDSIEDTGTDELSSTGNTQTKRDKDTEDSIKEYTDEVLETLFTGESSKQEIIDYIDNYKTTVELQLNEVNDDNEITSTDDAIDDYVNGKITDPEEAENIKQMIIDTNGEEYYEHLMDGTLDSWLAGDELPEEQEEQVQQEEGETADIVKEENGKAYVNIDDLSFDSQGIATVKYKGVYLPIFSSEVGFTPKYLRENYLIEDFRLLGVFKDDTGYYAKYTSDDDFDIIVRVTDDIKLDSILIGGGSSGRENVAEDDGEYMAG